MTVKVTYTSATTGIALAVTFERLSDGKFWDSDGVTGWVAAPSVFADDKYALTEGAAHQLNSYTAVSTGSMGDAGLVRIRIHNDGASDEVIAAAEIYVWNSVEVTGGGILEELSTDHTVTGSISDAITAIKAIIDAIGLDAATNLALTLSDGGVQSFVTEAGTLSTTVATTDLVEATTDHYLNRSIIWVTGDLKGQMTAITAYSGTNGTLTYATLTEAPGVGDVGVII